MSVIDPCKSIVKRESLKPEELTIEANSRTVLLIQPSKLFSKGDPIIAYNPKANPIRTNIFLEVKMNLLKIKINKSTTETDHRG